MANTFFLNWNLEQTFFFTLEHQEARASLARVFVAHTFVRLRESAR